MKAKDIDPAVMTLDQFRKLLCSGKIIFEEADLDKYGWLFELLATKEKKETKHWLE